MELAVLMLIGGILETCSVSLVLPFVNAVMSPDQVMGKPYAIAICEILHIDSAGNFLVFLSVILAALYIFKNIYLLIEYSIQYRFVYGNMFAMQKKILKSFIGRPYEWFLSVDSGEVMRVVNGDTTNAFNLLITLLMLFTEMIVSAMLVITIFVIVPFVTIFVAFILIAMVAGINYLIKPSMRKAALLNQKSSSGMNKWLLQSIQGIKEIKVLGKENFFQDNYDRFGQNYIYTLRKSQTLNLVPRFLIEAISMSVLFLAVAVMILDGQDIQEAIPTLTAIIMAAFRLLPSVNRISSSLANVSYNEPMLDKMIENLNYIKSDWEDNPLTEKKRSEGTELTCKSGITLTDITYGYPDSAFDVLCNVGMQINKGESVGIIGASGAGKSTVVDIIMGLLQPQSGQIQADGIPITESNIDGWRRQIGYIPQTIFMLDDSIRANIAFGENEDGVCDEDVWDALRKASLDDFVRNLPDGLETKIGERGVRLSGGQRQRIGIARALYRDPDILILDEATSALDIDTESEIMESIHRLQGEKTMIIIAHRLSTIESCDHIYRIENSKILKER